MTDRIVFILLGAGLTFFLAAINFRLGILKELKAELKSFKETAFKLFVTKENCDLKREACNNKE